MSNILVFIRRESIIFYKQPLHHIAKVIQEYTQLPLLTFAHQDSDLVLSSHSGLHFYSAYTCSILIIQTNCNDLYYWLFYPQQCILIKRRERVGIFLWNCCSVHELDRLSRVVIQHSWQPVVRQMERTLFVRIIL